MSCLIKIKENYSLLSKNEKKIADYLIKNPYGADSLTVSDLSKQSNTNPSCVIRFVKKLGYDGYTDFRIDLAKEIGREDFKNNPLVETFTKSDSTPELIKKLRAFYLNSLDKTYDTINIKKIEKATTIIKVSQKVCIVGEGLSQLIGADLARKFLIVGIDAVCHQDAHIQLTQTNNLTTNDCLILISYSGRTSLTNIALKRAKTQNVPTISISMNANNYLTKNSTVPIFIPTLEKERKIGSIASRIATTFITDILYLGTVQDTIDETIVHVMQTRDVISSLKDF